MLVMSLFGGKVISTVVPGRMEGWKDVFLLSSLAEEVFSFGGVGAVTSVGL